MPADIPDFSDGEHGGIELDARLEDEIATPTAIVLTPRQHRALRYLARRHMRRPRIVQRSLPPLDDGPGKEIDTPAPVLDDEPEEINTPILVNEAIPALEAELSESPEPLDNGHDERNNSRFQKGLSQPGAHPKILFVVPTRPRVDVLVSPSPPLLPPLSRGISIPTGPGRMPETGIAPPRKARPSQAEAEKLRKRRKVLRHLARKHMRKARAMEYRARRRMWLSIASTILSLLLIFLSLATTGTVIAYRFYTQTQATYGSQVLSLRDLLPLDNLKMYDSKGVLLMQMTDRGMQTTVSLDQIAPIMQQATVATEDKNFWTNEGIDIQGILRAALDNLRSGRIIEGGSTITQQLIKNLVVGNQETIKRKLEELVLTPQLNSRYSKRDILEMYLNSIYYGQQAYGVDAAATMYFGLQDMPGKSAASQLDLAQAAMLAGIPSNPSAYDPLLHPGAGFARFQAVLGLMLMQGYITKVQMLDAMDEAQSPHFFKKPELQNRAPHFTNFVLSQLEQIFHVTRSQLSRSGMIVNTTLDISLQDKIQKIMQQHIAALRYTHNVSNAAEVLIDFHTGAVISLLGSINYYDNSIDGQFDVATQGYRQPGSSFKPYVYVTAFEQGISPGQAIDDAPTTIVNTGGSPLYYSPTNYDLHYHGHMTLRCALQNSLNIPAVRVLWHVGINAAMKTAYDMGITTYEGTPGYSLVLGGLGIRLIDHTSAMGTFANGGVHVPYYAVNSVISANTHKVLYQHRNNPGKRVISPQLAYMMTNVLSDNTDRIPEFFDCNVLQLYSNSQSDCWNGNRGVVRPAAAKTGTTSDFRDNWTIGYTTDFVMGVWAGNDDNSPMYNITGVDGAAPIWHDAMLVAEEGHPIRDFTYPGGLVRATVTYPDGVTSTDWYLPGKVPTFALHSTSSPAVGQAQDPLTTLLNPLPLRGGYCPSYSFAFPPPPPDNIPPVSSGWW